jgi:hypothetical protein
MTDYENRRAGLTAQIDTAEQSLASLPADQRDSVADELTRLENTLGFARVVIEKTDPELMSEAAHQHVSSALTQIEHDPVTAATSPASADTVLQALLQLPAARGELAAQKLKEVVANVQRSGQMRLHALERQIQETKASFGDNAEALQARLTQLGESIEAEKTQLESLSTEQAEHFRIAQEERGQAFSQQSEDFQRRITELEERQTAEAQSHLEEIKRMEEETRRLVGAISIAGSANRYGKIANEQRTAANIWRIASVVTTILAAGPALEAVLTREQDVHVLVAKLAVSAIILAAAKWMAGQSERHRDREDETRDAELDLAAFPPFIERLPGPDQIRATLVMADRMFGQARRGTERSGDGAWFSRLVDREGEEGDAE